MMMKQVPFLQTFYQFTSEATCISFEVMAYSLSDIYSVFDMSLGDVSTFRLRYYWRHDANCGMYHLTEELCG